MDLEGHLTWRERALGPALTLLALVVAEVLTLQVYPPLGAAPSSLIAPILVVVAVSAFIGGRASGLVSAAIVIAYAAARLTVAFGIGSPDFAFRFAGIAVGAVALAWITGAMRERIAHLTRERIALEARAREEARARSEELEHAVESLEAFTFIATHDLKEPVRALQETLSRATDEREVVEARALTGRLSKLLYGLLEYSRASLASSGEVLDVAEVVHGEACEAQYLPLLTEREGRLEVAPLLPRVMGDPTALAQALGNLILNAVKHGAPERPLVRIAARHVADVVEVRITDDGPGFPDHVVKRFAGVRSSRPSTIRGGFGLVIARRAVERMGGTMTLGRAPSGGGEVRLTLRPAHSAHAPEVEPPRAVTIPVQSESAMVVDR